jgi:hypothetical protein
VKDEFDVLNTYCQTGMEGASTKEKSWEKLWGIFSLAHLTFSCRLHASVSKDAQRPLTRSGGTQWLPGWFISGLTLYICNWVMSMLTMFYIKPIIYRHRAHKGTVIMNHSGKSTVHPVQLKYPCGMGLRWQRMKFREEGPSSCEC